MSIPVIDIDLSAVLLPWPLPRCLSEVPVGHRFMYQRRTYRRVEADGPAYQRGFAALDEVTSTVEWFEDGQAKIEYLGPDGKVAAAGEEVPLGDCKSGDVFIDSGEPWECIQFVSHGDKYLVRDLRPERGTRIMGCMTSVRRVAHLVFKTGANNGK